MKAIPPSPLATLQPPHPPTAPEAASRRGRHGCGATPPRGCRVHHAALAMRHWELAATQWTEFHGTTPSPTSPGESSARLPAGLRPHRHLWCLYQSTWSAQKGTVGIKGRQSVAVPLASDFCKSDHLQLSMSHFWPVNVAKNVVKETAVTMALNIREKTTLCPTNCSNIATFARRGTNESLLLSNWSSWRRAASATQRMEFDRKTESATSPGESCARLPAGLRPHRHWCFC